MAEDMFPGRIAKEYRVKVETAITDLSTAASDSRIFALMLCRELLGAQAAEKILGSVEQSEKETYCYRTSAELYSDGEHFRICYRESDDVGLDGCTTVLDFKRSEPGRLNMMRTGGTHTSMSFDTSRKVIQCTYGSPPYNMSFGVFTRKLKNGVSDDGGQICVDYIIIFNGKSMERNELRITLSEAPS